MDRTSVLKAIADETRMKILTLLLEHNCCVRALARNLELSEATISQHLKILREAGLISGEKRGYFMHYDVKRSVLRELAGEIKALASIEREICTPEKGRCLSSEQEKCHVKDECIDDTKNLCHGSIPDDKEDMHHGHCKCHKP
ncbi:ArsR/SmtB family transcription factor [Lutispora saccharofermentans]|uniref:Metalloregulator ArsR/SmtB family transcription factor n=1 Tax=Lutispora saccharofermentans TaxID=3024236 RepID=A0ABT1NEK2_9FIRM|nr:metalloregulator ArsR/SmtB family transcription factor [Lutispora saccharofermentans]MCQ1529670.1 metalloregulator ArsR/SmtB family transcription factor [Lutispora saccharofermentans]